MAGPAKIGGETVDSLSIFDTRTAELPTGGFATAQFDIDASSSALLVRYNDPTGEEAGSVTLLTEYWSNYEWDVNYVYSPAMAIGAMADGGTIISATIVFDYFIEDPEVDDPDRPYSVTTNYSAILNEDGSVRSYFAAPQEFAPSNIVSGDDGRFLLLGYDGSTDVLSARLYEEDGDLVDGSISMGASAGAQPVLPSAAAIDGGYVVAWTSVAGPPYTFGVASMQLLDQSGGEVGGPIEIAANGKDISVTALEGERFIVTWTEADGSGSGVHAQLYSAAGATIGDEFIVNGETGGDQSQASVTELSDGSYVVVWTDASGVGGDSSGTAVKGQIFAATGERLGDEFLVNTETDGSQEFPRVTALAGDRFVVQWATNAGVAKEQIFDASNLTDHTAPTIEGLTNDLAAENAANGAILGYVEASDAGTEPGDMRFALLDDADGRFSIGAGSGAVRVADGLRLDYEQQTSFVIKVQVTDGVGNTSVQDFTVNLSDVSPETVNGDGRDNRIVAGAGADLLLGAGGADTLEGGGDADTLNGGAGVDRMVGGGGDDLYYADQSSDVVVEAAGNGVDQVRATASYTLAANVEKLALYGAADIDATGNGLANELTGNAGDNVLDGKGGADLMRGQGGDDTYVVDNGGDVVVEAASAGIDTVKAAFSYTLGANVENLVLSGSNAANGAGNGLDNLIVGNGAANVLRGNDGADTLDGGGGADTMIGGAGDDTYRVGDAGDVVTEAANSGVDRVISTRDCTLAANVENLSLTGPAAIDGTGNALANSLVGNAAANTLSGMGGADVLNGGLGADVLVGGAGADTFRFSTALDGLVNVDTISDFSAVDDTIQLAKSVFGGLPLGTLSADAFVIGTEAADGGDRIIYNSSTGALLYDADGVGGAAATRFATLASGLSITADDFRVI